MTWPTTSPTGSRSGQRNGAKLPRIFYVNWFRKDADGKFLWPGYGENSRVLAWIFRRCEGKSKAVKTPIGLVPAAGELNLTGLDLQPDGLRQMLEVDRAELRGELPQIAEHLGQFGERLPAEIGEQLRSFAIEIELNKDAAPTASERTANGRLTPTRTSTTTGKAKRPRR